MKRIWTIVGVADVQQSLKWYQALFGQPETREFSLRDPDGYYVTMSEL